MSFQSLLKRCIRLSMGNGSNRSHIRRTLRPTTETSGQRGLAVSALDDIAGLGPGHKKRLVRELGGVSAVKAASRQTLGELSWLPDKVADAVFTKLHG